MVESEEVVSASGNSGELIEVWTYKVSTNTR